MTEYHQGNELAVFAARLREILHKKPGLQPGHYLDLAEGKNITTAQLGDDRCSFPSYDPLAEAFSLIITEMRLYEIDKIKIGINEFFKAYLIQINPHNQKEITDSYLNRIYLLFLYFLRPEFPYTLPLWNYISKVFETVADVLIETKLIEGCRIFLGHVMEMGKIADAQGLETSSIQRFFRMIEVRAEEEGFAELASWAKNCRFNM